MPDMVRRMKHGKKPTLKQKKLLSKEGLLPEDWLIVKTSERHIEVVHRSSREIRRIDNA